MPPTAAKGPLLEARVARLLHAEGGFVRRAVDLGVRFREHFQVTDIDVLAFFFDRTLETRIVNGECKATEAKSAPSSADRLLWLVGVARLIDSKSSFLATTKSASDNTRGLAARLGSEILDPRDLERREQLVGLTDTSPYGTQAPDLAALAADVLKTVKPDDELRRVYGFARSDLWLAPTTIALKRAIGACRVLGGRYSENLPEKQRSAVMWLASETITGITLALTRIAALAYRQPEDVFERHLHERLAEGAASYAAMQEMSKTIDKFMLGMLTEFGVDPAKATAAIGAFEPKPPAYAGPLVELVQRLALAAPATVDLPRLAEHYLLGALHAPVRSAPVPASNEPETARLLRLVATFLERQAQLPAELLEPLRKNGRAQPSNSQAETQPAHEHGAQDREQPTASREDGTAPAAEEAAQPPQLFHESGS
ncbi:MAG: hypothetical protein WD249_05410 [Gaiellaceae bacterium]